MYFKEQLRLLAVTSTWFLICAVEWHLLTVKTVYHQMVEWFVNDELEIMRKEAFVVFCMILSQYFPIFRGFPGRRKRRQSRVRPVSYYHSTELRQYPNKVRKSKLRKSSNFLPNRVHFRSFPIFFFSNPTTRHGGAWGERRYSSYSFSTSALDGGEWSASRPGRAFTPGERAPGTHWTRGWVGPRAGLNTEARGKILCPPGIEPRSPGRPVRSQTLYCLTCL
jgi:hypothetical protein